ncbi:hypothetical protein ANO11243_049950 [Dothideomycetidae sp. 11243]|nr:hypothetical protein ANO11243_049950 [fungal sp. No.11243]
MDSFIISPGAGAIVAAFLVVGYLLYLAAFPKPIPGIPYHKESARRLGGDLPRLFDAIRNKVSLADYLARQPDELGSPIVQIFLKPFSHPIVILVDPRECHDIMVRRAREFDRSNGWKDIFTGTMPNNHLVLSTGERFRAQRKLLMDTMAPQFLHTVAATHAFTQCLHLIKAWRLKSDLGGGRPFDLGDDITELALEIIWSVAFGSDLGTIKRQCIFLEERPHINRPADIDQLIRIPRPRLPDDHLAVMHLLDGIEVAIMTPSYRKAKAHKDKLIQDRLDDAKLRSLDPQDAESANKVNSASDFLVFRECRAAEKEGRSPQVDSPEAKDELFGFLVAGHETTSGAIQWGVKYLADNPAVQTKLRADLHAACDMYHQSGELPSAEAIIKADLPYLDAVIEEILRLGNVVPTQARTTTHDTEVLGRHIPRGVDLIMTTAGAASTDGKYDVPDWDPADIAAFMPERWLKSNHETGALQFNPLAGTSRPFGAGIRGCFGRKLALLELRLIFFIVCWCFELPRLPKMLSSYEATSKLANKPAHCFGRPIWQGIRVGEQHSTT